MQLKKRVELLIQLGQYILEKEIGLKYVVDISIRENGWFTEESVWFALENICFNFLQKERLENWLSLYDLSGTNQCPKQVGVIMAGNLPLVGFHDFISVFISGHNMTIKLSGKDARLLTHLVEKLYEWQPETKDTIKFAEMLKGCEALIATGSNNSGRYFDYYFSQIPHIFRSNRTSVAILEGIETEKDLSLLANDILLYFGKGCRSVTKVYVPKGYDFKPLLDAINKYSFYSNHNLYKNNYDYRLAIMMLDRVRYLCNDAILITENHSLFSPIAVLHFEYYESQNEVVESLVNANEVQCIVGKGFLPFGQAQSPSLSDYADGVDTMAFLINL